MDLLERRETTATRHPWERARSAFFLRLLRRLGVDRSTHRWLDVGAGDAWFAQQLAANLPQEHSVVCWDINYAMDDLTVLHRDRPGLHFVATQPPGRFDGLMLLDVVEHVEDDLGFLTNLVNESMTDDGWVLVSVPAYQRLFSAHDVSLRHFRRYSPRQCSSLLRKAGLSIEAHGGLFHSLLAVRSLQALHQQLRPQSDDAAPVGVGAWERGRVLSEAITLALDVESRLSLVAATTLPVTVPGLSFWAFCRKASQRS